MIVSVSARTCLPLHRTPAGCSSSSRHHQPRRLRTHRRGRRARSTSCGCRIEEGRTWRDAGWTDQTQEVVRARLGGAVILVESDRDYIDFPLFGAYGKGGRLRFVLESNLYLANADP